MFAVERYFHKVLLWIENNHVCGRKLFSPCFLMKKKMTMFAVENCFNEKENYHVRGRKLFALCFFKYIKKETDHVRGRKGNDQGLEFLHRAPTLKMMLIMMMLVMIMTMTMKMMMMLTIIMMMVMTMVVDMMPDGVCENFSARCNFFQI